MSKTPVSRTRIRKRPIPEDLKKIKDGFAALITGIMRTREFGKDTPLYEQFRKDTAYLYKRITKAEKIVKSIAEMKMETSEAKHTPLIKMFGYLGLVESIGVAIVDFSVILLIANGSHFHIDSSHTVPRVRHAISIKDLEKERVSLGTKLGFLEQNQLGFLVEMMGFPSKKKGSRYNLRNAIAHLNFRIDDDTIYFGSHGRREINIDTRIKKFKKIVTYFKLFLMESKMLDLMKKQAEREGEKP